jgi:hypothetical protein
VSLIDYSGVQDMSIPVIDPQGDLVVAALVIAVVFAVVLRLRQYRRTRAA